MTVYRRPDPIPVPRKAFGASAPAPVADERGGLHHRVSKQLFIAIAAGELKGILPNEYALSEELGVSRTALREAIKALISKGLVETRRRRGTMVLDRSRWNMLDADVVSWSREVGAAHQISRHLWTAIVSTQPTLARLAAGKRGASRVLSAASLVQEARNDLFDRAIAFADFHIEVANASGNPFLTSLIVTCFENLLKDDIAFVQSLAAGSNPAKAGQIAALIAGGHAEESERAMRNYVCNAIEMELTELT